MSIYRHSLLLTAVGAVTLALVFQGCSAFTVSGDGSSDDSFFRPTSAARPVPAEIANDWMGYTPPARAQAPVQIQAQPIAQAPAVQPQELAPAEVQAPVPETPSPEQAPLPASKNQRSIASVHSNARRATHGSRGSRGAGTYVVKEGDTLMKIAFETFGDLYRWKDIYSGNKAKLGNFNVLTKGMVLNLPGGEYVVVERNGKPYLIKRRDTLQKISDGLYGTISKWKLLWENNRQLIHDPNKIYAGFTLYYQPSGRMKPIARPLAVAKPISEMPDPAKADVKAAGDASSRAPAAAPEQASLPTAPISSGSNSDSTGFTPTH